ncbi:MAG: DUF1929 domain-containing protein [Solirubrobacteraceae bacterium]|nr:DUF1929 domain-containing protein [Solirubrobacteraceae bacterium]
MLARLLSTVTGLLAVTAATATVATAADPAQTGQWSALQQYPVIPISAAVMPDGNIVAWDQADPGVPHGLSPNSGKAMIIDPDRGVIGRSANLAPTSVFCTLITTLPDGKVALVGGGNESYNSDRNVLYDPESKTFGAWGNMSRGRWYPGGQIDKTGNIVAMGGRGGSGADVIDAATGANRRLTGVNFDATYYPHVLRMPDGRYTVESISQTNAPIRSIMNTAGTGTMTPFADRTLLQPRLRLTSTMVGPYTSLMIGGGTLKTSYTLDVSSGTPVARPSGTMKYPRITATAVTLPDGSALTIGGNASNSETTGIPVMTPELWSPATGQWTSMEDSPRQRQYHSVAALLPDGRVWSAGTSARGIDEYNGAYFTPPSHFKKDGSGQLADRPTVQDAPKSVAWGQTFSVRSPEAASIRKAALIRLAANTHQYSFDQTYVPLDITRDGDRISMTVPANGNTIPAGQYMLFLTDSAGVPSKAPVLRVDPTSNTTPNVTVTQSSQLRSLSARLAFDGDTTNWKNGEFNGSHTLVEQTPWWQVDFGRSRSLENITIYTRTDRFQARTRNVWVFASDQPFTSTSIAETQAQPGVTAIQLPGIQPQTVTVNLNRSARYVRIQLPHPEHLNLREVVPKFDAVAAPNLGVAKVGQTDTQVTVKVTNTGNGPGTIQSVGLPGAGWSQTGGPGAPFTVAAGSETTLTLARGTVDGDLVLTPATGAALRLALDKAPPPPVADLSVSRLWQSSTQIGVRIANAGDGAGTIQSVTLPGAGWSQTSGPSAPFVVGAGGDTTLTLARGTVDGDLVLTPSSGAVLRLALEKAPPVPAPNLALTKVGQTDTQVTVKVANTGDATGTIESIALPGAGWVRVGGPAAPFAVAAGGETTLTLTRGTVDGDLVLTPSTGSALRLALEKAPPAPTANLALTKTAETDTQVTVKVANSGNAGGTIQTVTVPGAGWAQTSGPSAPFTVGPGAEQTLAFTRGTVDGDLVLTPTAGGVLRLALTKAPVPDPDPEPSTVPDPTEGGWQLNGSSTINRGALQLTAPTSDQRGTAFWPTALDTSSGLTIEFDATIDAGSGADGLTMVLADPARGATPVSIGGGGGHLGFGGIPGWAVALGSFPNGTQTSGNYVGLSNGAQAGAWQTLSWLQTTPLLTPLQNTTRKVRVTIAAGTVTVALDGVPMITRAVDLPNRLLLGFSAATGGLTNRHAISDVDVRGGIVEPPPPPPPSSVPDPAAGGWQLNGSSTITGGALQLTAAAADQKGSAFYPTPVTVGTGITVEYEATVADGSGADGLTLALADPARGAVPTSIGGGGGHLGFGGIPGWAVALSSFPNGTQSQGNFIGISDGALAGAWQTLNWRAAAALGTPLQNTTRRVKVTLTRTSISASIDGGLTVTHAATVPERILLGFTASTGGLTNRHAISNLTVSG